MNKYHNWINTALIVALFIVVAVGGNQPDQKESLGGGSRFPNGISADSAAPSAGETRGTTLTITNTASVSGLLTTNAGHLKSYTNATSTTATTQTLAQADILGYDTILLTPNTGALTLTLPATSTLTSFIPSAGDMQETCLYNATSTASQTITLAAGTGIDLERVATSTSSGSAGIFAIQANNSVCLKFIRETDTDISVLATPFIDAD